MQHDNIITATLVNTIHNNFENNLGNEEHIRALIVHIERVWPINFKAHQAIQSKASWSRFQQLYNDPVNTTKHQLVEICESLFYDNICVALFNDHGTYRDVQSDGTIVVAYVPEQGEYAIRIIDHQGEGQGQVFQRSSVKSVFGVIEHLKKYFKN